MDTTDPVVDSTLRSEVIEGLFRHLNDNYVFPDVAAAMEEAIRRRLSNGEYDAITTGLALCDTLTAHLQEISHDKHLRMFYNPEPRAMRDTNEPTPEERAEFHQFGMLNNFGFQKVERLLGNIGYLDLRTFFSPEFAGETAVAAMNLLAHTSALIVDLRQNSGGDAAMVALLATYLFDELVELSGIYWRADDRTSQSWTLPFVPGKRSSSQPVYVLTSGATFSAAEAFAYDLKHLKRATIIGEVTGGGAHPGRGGFQINEHFSVGIPTGRAVSPITGSNWEGTGVVPDIAVPQEQALTIANIAALRKVIENAGDNPTGPFKAVVEEAQAALAELEKEQPGA